MDLDPDSQAEEPTIIDSLSPATRAVLDAVPEAIVVCDAMMKIRHINTWAAELFGFPPGALYGQPITKLVAGDDDDSLERARFALNIAPTKPTQARQSLQGHRADTTEFPVDVSCREAEIDDKALKYFAFRDMTEQEQALSVMHYIGEELKERNQELEQFTYLASHDLKEPLRSVKSFVHLLSQSLGEDPDEVTAQSLRFIGNGVERMNALIHNLLEYSRTGNSGKAEDVDLQKLLDEVRQNLDAMIRETDAVVETGDLPVVHGVRADFVHLFQNLISNALKFRRKDVNPAVRIEATPKGEGWKISVNDNGIGIPEDKCETIFKPFQRLHNRTEFEGTGIGLAHCRKIIDRHGGKIWAEPLPEGGSSFQFTLNESSLF